MRLLLRLVAKDLKRKLRAPLWLAVTLSFPLVFSGMIALVFGPSGKEMPKVRMLVVNEDGGFLSNALASVYTSRQAAEFFEGKTVDAATGRALMEEGKASALLTIPKSFGADLLDGKPVRLGLTRNPAEGILPEIAEQTTGTVVELLDGARRVFDGPIATIRPTFDGDAAPSEQTVIDASLAVRKALVATGGVLDPPVIALDSELFGGTPAKMEEPETGSMIFILVLPGVAVYALFLLGDQAMRDVMTERTLGTLRRQLAGPLTASTFLAGKVLYTAALSLAALVLLAAVGAVLATTRVDVPGFVVVSLALVLGVTGTSAAIYGLAKTERQAATLASIVYLAMAFVSGSFIRYEGLPPALKTIAPFTPFYWATDGYRKLLESGAGLGDVLPNAGVLVLMGTVLLAVGVVALRRSVMKGAAA